MVMIGTTSCIGFRVAWRPSRPSARLRRNLPGRGKGLHWRQRGSALRAAPARAARRSVPGARSAPRRKSGWRQARAGRMSAPGVAAPPDGSSRHGNGDRIGGLAVDCGQAPHGRNHGGVTGRAQHRIEEGRTLRRAFQAPFPCCRAWHWPVRRWQRDRPAPASACQASRNRSASTRPAP